MNSCDNSESLHSADEVYNHTLDGRFPRRRCSSGVLVFDANGHVLLVKPSYREEWLIPGGIVESGESPAEAAVRELLEETKLAVRLSSLICVDVLPASRGFSESLHYLFSAECDTEMLSRASPDGTEIVQMGFYEPRAAIALLPDSLARRLTTVFRGHTGYLENGLPILPFKDNLEDRAPQSAHQE
ncbi:MAG TPA: NUDIX hydrolase [Stenotrophomonas sp.]|nr:NUDIX hydrolase [Stenotrophomonas sp.]